MGHRETHYECGLVLSFWWPPCHGCGPSLVGLREVWKSEEREKESHPLSKTERASVPVSRVDTVSWIGASASVGQS